LKNRTFCTGLFLLSILSLFSGGFFSNNQSVCYPETEWSYQSSDKETYFDVILNNSINEFQKEERTEGRSRRKAPNIVAFFKKAGSITKNSSEVVSKPSSYHAINKYTYLFYSSVKTTAPPKFS